jgi:hypothetical protein
MSISMYQACVPGVLKMMTSLVKMLDKGAAWAEARKLKEADLLNARLYPDMYTLTRQIQTVSDGAKGMTARLAGQTPPSMPDTETTVAELKARLEKTIEYVKSLHPSSFDGSETRTITLNFGDGRKVEFNGQDYLFTNALPNFYFHATTAYDIMRHIGVDLAKRNFLGG